MLMQMIKSIVHSVTKGPSWPQRLPDIRRKVHNLMRPAAFGVRPAGINAQRWGDEPQSTVSLLNTLYQLCKRSHLVSCFLKSSRTPIKLMVTPSSLQLPWTRTVEEQQVARRQFQKGIMPRKALTLTFSSAADQNGDSFILLESISKKSTY